MKKILSAILLLCFIGASARELPEYALLAKPNQYRSYWLTPEYVLNAKQVNAYDIGISNNTQIWKSVQVNDSTFEVEGLRVVNDKIEYRVWSDHIICSGSGSCSVSSQGSLARGDRDLIVAGTYTGGGGFTNVVGVTFIPQTVGHTVTVTTNGWGWRSNDSCELGYISFIGISGNALDERAYSNTFTGGNGPIQHSYQHHLYFSNVTGACINANGGMHYVPGDSTTAQWLDNKFDSITEDQCGLFCQGSFGSPVDNAGQPPAVMIRLEIARLLSTGTTSTTNRGTEIRGIIFEGNFHDWIVVDTSGLGNSGDCGLAYGHGNGIMHHVIKIGPGPGYLWRMSPTAEVGRPGKDWFYDCFKFYTTDYGMFQCQNPDSVAGAFRAIDELWVTHNTAGRMMSDNNYWCQLLVIGDLRSTGASGVTIRLHEKNNFAFEVTDHASGDAGHDNGTYTLRLFFNMGVSFAIDTSNNQYYPTLAAANMDTTHFTMVNGYKIPQIFPKSNTSGNILGGGVADGITTADYNGTPWRSPPDIGYLNLPTTTPPCTTCFPGFKYAKKHG